MIKVDLTLEEQSFINLVNYYRDELLRLYHGEPISKVIPEKARRIALRKHCIIKQALISNGGSRMEVSPKALSIIETTTLSKGERIK